MESEQNDEELWVLKRTPIVESKSAKFTREVGQALKRALKRAKRTAKMHGTKLYFSRDGKIVAEKP